MYEQVRQVVLDSGLWNNGGISRYGFVLSPSVYEVSPEKREELEALGAALYDCLAGLGRIMAIASTPQFSHSNTWRMIARALSTGVPKIYDDLISFRPSNVPSICKVDIMESQDGNLRIAEIDGHNKHGLGYSTLAARIRRVVMPEAQAFPGVASAIAKEAARRGENTIVLLYAYEERFYLPEFHILQAELADLDLELVVIAESDTSVENGKVVVSKDGKNRNLFVDLPFLYRNPQLNTRMAELYCNGEINFLIPPKPFFGSKAVLALLRNDIENGELEAILKSQIPSASLEVLRQHIPETYLVHKWAKEEYWRSRCGDRRFVLKESISSGMKGTVFTDDSQFAAILRRACGSYYRYILQEEVTNRPHRFQYFTEGGELVENEWFLRVTVHYAGPRVADVIVTARQDKKVHGALDCLQIGSIVV